MLRARYLILALAQIIFGSVTSLRTSPGWRRRFHGALTAEDLLLRKELTLFQERKVRPHCAIDATQFLMVLLGRLLTGAEPLSLSKQILSSDRISENSDCSGAGRPSLVAGTVNASGDGTRRGANR